MPSTTSNDGRDLQVLRREYLDAVDTLLLKGDQVHHALDSAAAALTQVRDHLEQDGRASDLANTITPTSVRAMLSTSLDELERARHHAQRLLFRILEAEGQRKSVIARSFGISRQLVSRMIHESDT